MVILIPTCVYSWFTYIPIRALFVRQIVKRDQKSFVINISKEYSIVSQFTSFVAIEEREKVRKISLPVL